MSSYSGHGQPRVIIEALRPRFWEVAVNRRNVNDFVTPFHEMRVNAQMTDREIAEKMDMSLDEYLDFELGRVRPLTEDILDFCDAADCHPLDLYAEPWNGIPLPREILEALTEVFDDTHYSEDYRDRARDRLILELHHAEAMVGEHVNDMKPLLVAMGYSQDLKRFNAPLYKAPEIPEPKDGEISQSKSLVPSAKKMTIDSRSLIDDGVLGSPRLYIENCLNAHELELEERYRTHHQLSTSMAARITKNQDVLHGLATFLYGEEGGKTAVARLHDWLNREPFNRDSMREQFLQNMNLIGSVLPDHISAFAKKEQDKVDEIMKKARLFFHAGLISHRNQEKFPGESVSNYMRSAYHEWNGFRVWRASTKTQRQIDWFGNWLVLCGTLRGQDPLKALNSSGSSPSPAP